MIEGAARGIEPGPPAGLVDSGALSPAARVAWPTVPRVCPARAMDPDAAEGEPL